MIHLQSYRVLYNVNLKTCFIRCLDSDKIWLVPEEFGDKSGWENETIAMVNYGLPLS